MILAPAFRKTLRDGSTGCLGWHESQRPGQSRTDRRCGWHGRFVDLLALQIRQNTNAIRSAAAQTVHEHFASWYRLVAADPELSEIVVNGLRDYSSLSEMQRARFIATYMAFVSYSQNAFLKWRERSLAPPLWMGWELVIMNLVCAPEAKPSGKIGARCLVKYSGTTWRTIL